MSAEGGDTHRGRPAGAGGSAPGRSGPVAAVVRRLPMPWPVVGLAAAAVVLRLFLFLGRGHYVAFDEGWYLVLGRNLWSGDGYTLSGLKHVALSPLFPILAGALDLFMHDAVWSGRIVAALAAGLLVLPCWSIFDRVGGRKVAYAGALFVALMPSLAPFVVPYWIEWDLWVGAEPLLHLFLFSGIALFIRAWEDRGLGSALGCGAAFALAYLARPEAIVAFGLLGVAAVGFAVIRARAGRIGAPPAAALAPRVGTCAVAFVVMAAPYWIYLHDSLGRWTITGRAVQMVPESMAPGVGRRQASPNRIETMLWQGDSSPYIQSLYALTPSAMELANGYWGVPAQDRPGAAAAGDVQSATGREAHEESSPGTASPPQARGFQPGSGIDAADDSDGPGVPDTTPFLLRYGEALGVAVPWYLWLLVIPGLAAPGKGRRLDLEALVGLPLVATSILIARVVAIDPRTQLFIAPLAAFYAARGVLVVVDAVESGLGERVRREVASGLLVGAVLVALLGTSVGRLFMSLTVGSPHHVVAAQNAAVGAAIGDATSEDATVMSFHPAIALFADRDWRVLPLEPMDRIVRYARTQPNPYMVLSVFYPPEVRPLEEPHYLIVPVPADLPEGDRWRIEIARTGTVMAFGELVAAQ